MSNDLAASAQEIKHSFENRHGKYDVEHSSYKLAFLDSDYLSSHDTRGLRFQLEIGKPDSIFRREKIKYTIVVFGSARFKSPEQAAVLLKNETNPFKISQIQRGVEHYQKARKFGEIVALRNLEVSPDKRLHILTGGGPGIMEAANRGAFEAGDKTIGMNIALPFEQEPNPYITPELCFDFHYFACRKFSFLSAGSSTYGAELEPGKGFTGTQSEAGGGAAALVCFAGGLGTLDELFEALTLIQTKKMKPRPVILVGKDYWNNFMDLHFLVEQGAMSQDDLNLFKIVDTPEEAWNHIEQFYGLI